MKRLAPAFLLLLAACSLGVSRSWAHSAGQTTCQGHYMARIDVGPDRGPLLTGHLAVSIRPSGGLSGSLARAGQGVVRVVGQANGRAISLVFELSGGRSVYGVGAARVPIRGCPARMGGLLSGPHEGDIGDWGYAFGG